MGTLVCRIELNKTDKKGITITVENADGKITQTMQMDGTSIITKVKGDKETSTITQKQDSIVIKCKDFKLDAETITCISSKATKHTSKDIYSVTSTKDLSLTSKAKIAGKATQDVTIDGMNVVIKAKTDAKIDATNFKANAKMKADIAGTQVKVAGTAQVEVSGPQAKFAGNVMTEVGGGATTMIKGGMIQVQGMVKAG
jgi:predicted secreted protein